LVAGLTVLALGLSGCGRKGPLDPPPGASVAPGQQQAQTQTQPQSPAGIFVSPVPEESQPAEAAKAPQRRIFLDGLLN
jgi:predicted small lipoprotein YifL